MLRLTTQHRYRGLRIGARSSGPQGNCGMIFALLKRHHAVLQLIARFSSKPARRRSAPASARLSTPRQGLQGPWLTRERRTTIRAGQQPPRTWAPPPWRQRFEPAHTDRPAESRSCRAPWALTHPAVRWTAIGSADPLVRAGASKGAWSVISELGGQSTTSVAAIGRYAHSRTLARARVSSPPPQVRGRAGAA